MFNSIRKNSHNINVWPGFVDALATVLMAMIFVLMTFVFSQLYLTDALDNKEEHVGKLENKIKELSDVLLDEKELSHTLSKKTITLEKLLQELNEELVAMNRDLATKDYDIVQQKEHKRTLLEETELLKIQLAQLLKVIALHKETNKETDKKVTSLSNKMKIIINEYVNELRKQQEKIKILEKQILVYQSDNTGLAKQLDILNETNRIDQYRSEFFSRLQKILGNRNDIRVVGDRFVFQSEVLFDKASADLGKDGQKRLNGLVEALLEISKTIPKNISWILRVDGHTDQLPIKSATFPSNWELSSARSIAVVKYLITKGIPAERLVAAGFGEYQPLAKENNEKSLARNRRIEFKLDQR